MNYTPDVKSLDYSDLNFVSTSARMAQTKVFYDVDALYDEVSAEVFALFIGEVTQQMTLEVVRQAQMV